MGSCLTCFKAPPNTTANSVGTAGLVSGPEATAGDPDAAVHETADLLAASPIRMPSLGPDRKSGSFKKTIGLLNGNVNALPDGTGLTGKDLATQISDNDLNKLFEEYKDDQEDAILSEGIERLCCDLGYKPDDFAILVLAWRLNASQMCQFTKSEFIQGLQQMNAASIEDVKARLRQNVEKLKDDSEDFKLLYRFTFRFGLEQGQRILPLDMAISLWRLVFTVHTPDILPRWLHFLEQPQNIRGVPRDTWYMFLNFVETCDITQYDDTEAWPSLFDDFVEYEQERAKLTVKGTPKDPDGDPEEDDNNNGYNNS
ncbi:DCN1-like protein 3 [Wyeomyia smithii]|uniref:DCN1-like protein 3 n=1 Tax=Wyeomyia smithii TaxID=174621 RepID=UPI002467E644|nr:DCN1-like protein 3 [Wyeomyia smithii]XP_055537124.1 DCN1-like protein 3 [Wyeomyia smithii]XP_055537125.1 DCN1-like protein 3 [Wyeomyia smithii]XP_055537126.1 DCN1-like protein 3 [Wyeomyia smithii]